MESSTIKIEGEYPDIDHVQTGCFTLDMALSSKSNIGMPTRTIYEISGHEHVGKSTLAYFLCSALKPEKIILCDVEGFDKEYVTACLHEAQYSGILHLISPIDEKKKAYRPHEDMLKETSVAMRTTAGVVACIVDSVGALIPIMEAEGDFGEAFMGRRAKLMAQVSRSFATTMINRDKAAIAVFVNHQQAILGGQGHTTPGGVTLKHLAACRINVWNKETIKNKEEVPIGYQIQGTVEKLRYGGKGRKFSVVNLGGKGINRDLTTMFDCFVLGLATRSATVKVNDKSVGFISKLFLDAEEGRHEKFEPFYEAIQDYYYGRLAEKKVEDNNDGTVSLSEELSDEEL